MVWEPPNLPDDIRPIPTGICRSNQYWERQSNLSWEDNHPYICELHIFRGRHWVDCHRISIDMLGHQVLCTNKHYSGRQSVTEGLQTDLNMSGSNHNVTLFIFFIPYIPLEIPSNIVIRKIEVAARQLTRRYYLIEKRS